jgi:hypothetical protein
MSVVNSGKGKGGKVGPPQFWWEEGYKENAQVSTTSTNNRLQYDADGTSFELGKYTTDLNHLDSLFFHHDNTIVSLRHQRSRSSSIALYSYTSGGGRDGNATECLTPHMVYDISDNSGYIGLSHDDRLLAVGVLNEDLIMIFDVMNGDLLVNVHGGYKLGYWGQLQFSPGNHNNTLLEVRTISMDKGKAKETVARTWDLGFKKTYGEKTSDNGDDVNEDDDDDDEETTKVWEIKRRGNLSCCRHENTIISTSESLQKLEWLDHTNGSILRQLSFSNWLSKPVISSDGCYVATAHFGYCLIHQILTGEIVGQIICSQNESNYPLLPIQFVHNNKYLICRISQERALIISDWVQATTHYSTQRTSSSTLTTPLATAASSVASSPSPAEKSLRYTAFIRQVGGTITEKAMSISHDEKYLVCWPYGVIELYDLEGMIQVLTKKLSFYQKFEFLKLRLLLETHRATLKTANSTITDVSALTRQVQEVQIQESSSGGGKKKPKSALKGGTKGNLNESQQQFSEETIETLAEDDLKLFDSLLTKLTNDLFLHVLVYL